MQGVLMRGLAKHRCVVCQPVCDCKLKLRLNPLLLNGIYDPIQPVSDIYSVLLIRRHSCRGVLSVLMGIKK